MNSFISKYKVVSIITYESKDIGLMDETKSKIVYFVTIDFKVPVTVVVDELQKIDEICDDEIAIIKKIAKITRDLPIKISIVNVSKDKRRIVILFESGRIKTNFVIRGPYYKSIDIAGSILSENTPKHEVDMLRSLVLKLKKVFVPKDSFKKFEFILRNIKTVDNNDDMTF